MTLFEGLLSAAIWIFVIALAVNLYRRLKRLEHKVEILERRRHKDADRGENAA